MRRLRVALQSSSHLSLSQGDHATHVPSAPIDGPTFDAMNAFSLIEYRTQYPFRVPTAVHHHELFAWWKLEKGKLHIRSVERGSRLNGFTDDGFRLLELFFGPLATLVVPIVHWHNDQVGARLSGKTYWIADRAQGIRRLRNRCIALESVLLQ